MSIENIAAKMAAEAMAMARGSGLRNKQVTLPASPPSAGVQFLGMAKLTATASASTYAWEFSNAGTAGTFISGQSGSDFMGACIIMPGTSANVGDYGQMMRSVLWDGTVGLIFNPLSSSSPIVTQLLSLNQTYSLPTIGVSLTQSNTIGTLSSGTWIVSAALRITASTFGFANTPYPLDTWGEFTFRLTISNGTENSPSLITVGGKTFTSAVIFACALPAGDFGVGSSFGTLNLSAFVNPGVSSGNFSATVNVIATKIA